MATNDPINMGPYLGAGGVVPDNPTPLFSRPFTVQSAAAATAAPATPNPQPNTSPTEPPRSLTKAAMETSPQSPLYVPPKGKLPPDQAGFDEGAIKQAHDEGVTAQQAFKSGEVTGGNASKWDQFVAATKNQSQSGWFGFYPGYEGSLARRWLENQVEDFSSKAGMMKYTPEEANQKYPGLPIPFKEDIYPEVAQLRWEAHQRRVQLEEWASTGGPSPWYTSVGAAVVGMADPGNLALTLATGGIGKAAGLARAGIAGLRNAFIENLAINAASEIPNYLQTEREGDKVSASESIKSVIGGAAGTTGFFHIALPLLGRGLGTTLTAIGERIPRVTAIENLKRLVFQHEMGSKLDTTPQGRELGERAAGSAQPGTVADPYQFQQLGHPSERAYYAAESASTGEHVPLDDHGPGIYGTDHGQIANNLASEPESPHSGKVHEMRVSPDSKFLDLNEPLKIHKKEAANEIAKEAANEIAKEAAKSDNEEFVKRVEAKTGIDLNLPPTATLKDALDHLGAKADQMGVKSEALTDAQSVAKEMGYDGYRYTSEAGGAQDNRVLMFEGSQGEHTGTFEANKESTPQAIQEKQDQLERAGSPETSPLATPETDQTIAKMGAQKVRDRAQLDPAVEDIRARAENYLNEAAKENPALAEDVAKIKREFAKDKQTQKMAEILAGCITNGVS